jgi:hypothetical protein
LKKKEPQLKPVLKQRLKPKKRELLMLRQLQSWLRNSVKKLLQRQPN